MVRKVCFLLAFLLMGFIKAHAVKAFPQPITVQQSDGTSLMIIGHGDEDLHYVTTLDGVLLVQEENGWTVAKHIKA